MSANKVEDCVDEIGMSMQSLRSSMRGIPLKELKKHHDRMARATAHVQVLLDDARYAFAQK